MEVEREFPDATPMEVVMAWLEEQTAIQEAFLDKREVAIKHAYGVPLPARLVAAPVPAKIQSAVSSELRKQLREAVAELEAITKQSVNVQVPVTEDEAKALLRQLRVSIFDAKGGRV